MLPLNSLQPGRPVLLTPARRQRRSIPANASRFMGNKPAPLTPTWQGATACNRLRPEAGHFPKPRTHCLQNVRSVRKMTRQALDVSRSLRASAHGTRTAFRWPCTKTAQRVYAEHPKHPPFTHFAVCSGNILQSCATYCTHPCTMGAATSSQTKSQRNRGFMQFLQAHMTPGTKIAEQNGFVHVCCIQPGTVCGGSQEVRAYRLMIRVAGLP